MIIRFSLILLLTVTSAKAQKIPIFKAAQANDSDFMSAIDEGPLEVMPGCSWYCGGFVSSYTASSVLIPFKNIDYSATKAHDFDINTAWIEGNTDYGIGEFLEYSFDMTTLEGRHELGITKIILANGYKKAKKAWQENSRVKKLKVYIDNIPYGQLELLDSFEFQTIEIGKILLPQRKVMKLKFEIMEVYPGTKYRDTAISELLFEGVGVH
jgi:hypothetical protein